MRLVSDRFEIGSTSQMLNDARALRRASAIHPIPDNAVPFTSDGGTAPGGSAATPAFGTQILLATYQVPIGWEGLLVSVMNTITGDGGSFIEGSGDLFWTIDIDIPLGAPLISGHFLPGYASVLRSLGNLSEQWSVIRGWRMKSGETYRYKVTNVQNVAVGSPSFCHGSLNGLVWPQCS